MRRCLLLAVGLFAGCITTKETDNGGVQTRRSYFLFVPLTKTVTQTQAHPSKAETNCQQLRTGPATL